MAATYLTREDDVLDDICWRHYGRQSGAVEAVLAANPGLAERAPRYPSGVMIHLPDIAAPSEPGPVRLWD